MKYRKKPVVIDAMTFEELVEYGKTHGGNIVNGIPWSFHVNGHPVTHDTYMDSDGYLISTLEGTMRMTKDDMLVIGVQGEIYPCKTDIFEATYERVES